MSEITDTARDRMEKCLEALKTNFGKVRTGRANPHVLDSIMVDYYGQSTPVTQLAGVKVPEASMLVVEPWDKTSLNAIEKAISQSDLGITPSNDGQVIRLPFPKPTGERRKELAKECRTLAEEARVAATRSSPRTTCAASRLRSRSSPTSSSRRLTRRPRPKRPRSWRSRTAGVLRAA